MSNSAKITKEVEEKAAKLKRYCSNLPLFIEKYKKGHYTDTKGISIVINTLKSMLTELEKEIEGKSKAA